MSAVATEGRDEVGELRDRLIDGEWEALTLPAGEGLLAQALLVDASWWDQGSAELLSYIEAELRQMAGHVLTDEHIHTWASAWKRDDHAACRARDREEIARRLPLLPAERTEQHRFALAILERWAP